MTSIFFSQNQASFSTSHCADYSKINRRLSHSRTSNEEESAHRTKDLQAGRAGQCDRAKPIFQAIVLIGIKLLDKLRNKGFHGVGRKNFVAGRFEMLQVIHILTKVSEGLIHATAGTALVA